MENFSIDIFPKKKPLPILNRGYKSFSYHILGKTRTMSFLIIFSSFSHLQNGLTDSAEIYNSSFGEKNKLNKKKSGSQNLDLEIYGSK